MNPLDKAFESLVAHGISRALAAYLVNLEARVIALEREEHLASAATPNREAGAVRNSDPVVAGDTAAEVNPNKESWK